MASVRKLLPLGMLALGLALQVGTTASAWGSHQPTPATTPIVLPADKIPRLIKALHHDTPFSITGVAFYNGRLFVGTNVGVMEFKDSVAQAVYQWDPRDAVVESPWPDEATGSLWIQRDDDGKLLRLDRQGWHVITLPHPPHEGFSRSDMLQGLRGVSDPSGFHLVGGGYVWKRENAEQWTLESSPPIPSKYSSIQGIAFSGSREVFVAEPCMTIVTSCGDLAFWREGRGWGPPINLSFCCVKQVLGTVQGVIARSEKGDLVSITQNEAVALPAPGPVEAITRTSKGNLLASIASAGIFVRDGERWTKLLDYPKDVVSGEHWAYLAERDGVVALATTQVPQLQGHGKFTYSGGTTMWVSAGTDWIHVDFAAR